MKMNQINLGNNDDFHRLYKSAYKHERTSHNSARHYLHCGGWMDSTSEHGFVASFGLYCPLSVIETKEQKDFVRKCNELLALKGTISDDEYKSRAMKLMA
jgi:hypothetical protein